MKTGTGPKYGQPGFKTKTISESKTRKGTLQVTPSKTKKHFRPADQRGV